MTLTAMRPVLYRSHQYSAGDELPGDDAATVAAWIECGSAKWLEEDTTEHPMAKQVGEIGKPGKSSDGDPEALVGRVPKRAPGKTSVPKSKKK